MDAATMVERIDEEGVAEAWKVLQRAAGQSVGRSSVTKVAACPCWRFYRGAAGYVGPSGLPDHPEWPKRGRLALSIFSPGLRNEDTAWPEQGFRDGTPEEILRHFTAFPGLGVPVWSRVRSVTPAGLQGLWEGWEDDCRGVYEDARTMALECYPEEVRGEESIRIHAARFGVVQVIVYAAWKEELEVYSPPPDEVWIGGRDVTEPRIVVDLIKVRTQEVRF